MDEARKLSKRYNRQSLWLVGGLTAILLIVMRVWYMNQLLTPIVACALFFLFVCSLTAIVWRKVAIQSPDNLPTFYTAESGARFLLALLLMFVYYLADKSGIKTFIGVFAIYYFATLIHTSLYFSRISNRLDKQKTYDEKTE